jgi:hypothetical protein
MKPNPNIWNDPVKLREWTLFQLRRLDADRAEWDDQRLLKFQQEAPPPSPLAAAVDCARRGNLGPLRNLLPALAGFLHRSPRSPRKRGPRREWFDVFAIETARATVPVIRQLWRDNFSKVNRTEQPTATALAAEWAALTEEQLLNDRKTRHRYRKR